MVSEWDGGVSQCCIVSASAWYDRLCATVSPKELQVVSKEMVTI